MSERFAEERLGELLRILRPAPTAWLRAAQELPAARRSLDDLIARAEADQEIRRSVIADLERALAEQGIEPRTYVMDELRRRLTEA
jgi:hypothetical protein